MHPPEAFLFSATAGDCRPLCLPTNDAAADTSDVPQAANLSTVSVVCCWTPRVKMQKFPRGRCWTPEAARERVWLFISPDE